MTVPPAAFILFLPCVSSKSSSYFLAAALCPTLADPSPPGSSVDPWLLRIDTILPTDRTPRTLTPLNPAFRCCCCCRQQKVWLLELELTYKVELVNIRETHYIQNSSNYVVWWHFLPVIWWFFVFTFSYFMKFNSVLHSLHIAFCWFTL